ncbi:signal peptide peptidase SppA [Parvibaculum sedimenti]|uniref:Signal peptide peptidase SppA n=1 Tax=Parvibaculum sedimenti TaxID=2608632 RepID=A0A6N6VPD7_9HYPH|nr:signal peptide peptidase SppA [Parvibaculum sedimenti]KAB7742705.1 signal peptide peptidase SppA [Parvibaculum sedimenti]
MSFDADAITDRRRLKRRLFFWRFAAVVAVAVAILAAIGTTRFHHTQIARVEITGIITDDRDMQKLLKELGDDRAVKAVILSIDSPGGTTTGAEALYIGVRQLAAKKPVVATLGTVAASGGYIAALSADHIVARGNTLTGSIGVLFEWPQFAGLMEKLGIEVQSVKSAPLKAEPAPYHKPSPEALAATRDLVVSSYDWFLGLVQERRKLDAATAKKLGDGRVYTGWQAVQNKLVDEIGGEDEAVKWLTTMRKVPTGLPVEDWAPEREDEGYGSFAGQAAGTALAAGIEALAGKTLQTKRLTLDGLTSVWHPDAR